MCTWSTYFHDRERKVHENGKKKLKPMNIGASARGKKMRPKAKLEKKHTHTHTDTLTSFFEILFPPAPLMVENVKISHAFIKH